MKGDRDLSSLSALTGLLFAWLKVAKSLSFCSGSFSLEGLLILEAGSTSSVLWLGSASPWVSDAFPLGFFPEETLRFSSLLGLLAGLKNAFPEPVVESNVSPFKMTS